MTAESRPWLRHYDAHVRPEIDPPDGVATTHFDEIVKKFGQRPALFFHGSKLTFGQLAGLSDRVAQALVAHGCRPGDAVAINLPNIPDYLIAQLGAVKAGCAASGLSPLLTPADMAYQLRDCRAKVLFTLDAIFEHRLAQVADELEHLEVIVASGLLDFLPLYKRLLGRWLKRVPTGRLSELRDKRVITFQQLLRRFPARPMVVDAAPDDVVLLQYTGGTTGSPKAAMLTHRTLLASLAQFSSWFDLQWGQERFLSAFPFFHLAGLAVGLGAVMLGAPQVLIPDPRDVKHVVKELRWHRPTFVANVPSMYMMLVDEPAFAALDFSQLKCCIAGAAPFSGPSFARLEQVVGRGKLVEVYGMTEASPVISMNPLYGLKKAGTVGIPVPSTTVRLYDLETGTREVARGEEGEIAVRGPQVMKGYLGKPEETERTLRKYDGETWLHTGDVARMDDDGYLSIVDRCKDMIIVSGYKVFSAEVEEKLNAHAAIASCAVVGVPNPDRPGSELVKLFVQRAAAQRQRPEQLVREEILAFAAQQLAPFKVPKEVEFVDELPWTPLGKVDKKALRGGLAPS